MLDLETGQDRLLASGASAIRSFGFSDDGERVAFLRDGQIYLAGFDGAGPRQLTTDPVGFDTAVLSGNGRIVYAVTTTGRLVKIAADTGDAVEIIGRTPDILTTGGIADAGMFTTITGRGFSYSSIGAGPPLPDSLGGVSVAVGGRKVPISFVAPDHIDTLIPWDLSGANLPVVLEAPAIHSPFDYPESTLSVSMGPRAGAIAHQNWDGLVTAASWPHTGEIIHVWAVGLGAVQPDVPPGAVSPSAEPFARLAEPIVCSNSEVLYAGLAPGYIARVYQVDMRLGSIAGYQPIECSIGNMTFRFLTFNILP